MQDKPEPVVKIDNLCMEFGETVALDGVSFEIQRGEIFVAYGILMGMTMIISIMGIFFSSVFMVGTRSIITVYALVAVAIVVSIYYYDPSILDAIFGLGSSGLGFAELARENGKTLVGQLIASAQTSTEQASEKSVGETGWTAFLALTTWAINGAVVFAYFFLFTGNRIRPSTDDRSSMLRLLTLVVLFTTLALAGLSLTTGMNDPSSGGVGVDSGGLGFLWWSAVITFFVGLYFSTESLLISGRLRRRFSQWSGIRFPFRLLVPGAFWGFLYTVVVVGFLSAVFYFVANYAPLTDLARTKFAGMAYTLPLYILAFSALGFFLSSCGFTQKDNFLTVFFIFVITLLLPLIFQHKNFSDGVLALYYLSPIMLYYSLTPDRFYEDEPQFVLFGEVPIIPVARRVFGLAAFVFFVMGLRAAQKEKLPLVRLGR